MYIRAYFQCFFSGTPTFRTRIYSMCTLYVGYEPLARKKPPCPFRLFADTQRGMCHGTRDVYRTRTTYKYMATTVGHKTRQVFVILVGCQKTPTSIHRRTLYSRDDHCLMVDVAPNCCYIRRIIYLVVLYLVLMHMLFMAAFMLWGKHATSLLIGRTDVLGRTCCRKSSRGRSDKRSCSVGSRA